MAVAAESSATSRAISAWKHLLVDWASSGQLTAAIQSVLAPTASSDKVISLVNTLADSNNTLLPNLEVLSADALRGHLGAYSSSRNTIYLSSELDSSPTLVGIVLTHELAHFLQDRILGVGDHAVINDFVSALIPSATEIFNAIRESGQEGSQPASSIVLPNGEAVKAKFFDTDLHITAENSIFNFMRDHALIRMALAQNHVDDIDIRNPYSLQFRSAAHFDNSNIPGSLAMIRGWYEDALDQFSKGDIRESKWSRKTKFFGLLDGGINTSDPKWISGKVNPAFAGENGGIDLLLYRFGQICHAFQDFYTHSNWTALVGDGRRQPIPVGSILDSGLGLPTILNAGDALPGTKQGMTALVATKGPDWAKILKLSARGGKNIYRSDQDVYWNVNANDSDKYTKTTSDQYIGLEDPWLRATTVSGNDVYGLATGATWNLLYPDEDFSIKFRDPFKEGSIVTHEYFNGFDHGGLAGTSYPVKNPISGKPLNTYLGTLSKDAQKSFGFTSAMALANAQIKNEWDRLGNLIFKRYGRSGLERFANYALFPEDRQLYINTYSTAGARWNWNKSLSYFTVEVTSPESFGNLAGAELRFVNIARRSDSSPTLQELVVGLQYKLPGGTWIDSALTDLSTIHRHGDLSDSTWRNILVPRPASHPYTGGRAYWLEHNAGEIEGRGRTYVVQSTNSDLRILLPDFDPLRDQITILGPDGAQVASYAGNWSVNEYASYRQELIDKYNIIVEAVPLTLANNQTWVIDRGKLRSVNGGSGGIFLTPLDLFDYSYSSLSPDSTAPSFIGYDNSLPFLSLVDGRLVAGPNLEQYTGRTYTALVSVSDGLSGISDHKITISVAPTLTTGKGDVIDPNQQYQIQFLRQDSQSYSIFEAIDQDNDQPGIDRFSILASVTGNINGNPHDWNPLSQTVRIGAPTDSGTVSFWIKKQDTVSPIKLSSTATANNGYDLFLADSLIARLSPVVQPVANSTLPFQVDTFSIADASADVTGFVLSKDTSKFRLDYTTNGSAAYSSRLGFVMMDILTGDIVDPYSGHHYESLAEDFAAQVEAYALFEIPIVRGANLPGFVEVNVAPSIDVRNMVFTPFIKTDAAGTLRIYSGNPLFNADGLEHVIKLGTSVLGVEDMYATTDSDYNDILFSVSGVTQL